jgi:hypothetical protein
MLKFIEKQLKCILEEINEYQNTNNNVKVSSLLIEKIKLTNNMLNDLLDQASGDGGDRSPAYLFKSFFEIKNLLLEENFDYITLVSVTSFIKKALKYIESHDEKLNTRINKRIEKIYNKAEDSFQTREDDLEHFILSNIKNSMHNESDLNITNDSLLNKSEVLNVLKKIKRLIN